MSETGGTEPEVNPVPLPEPPPPPFTQLDSNDPYDRPTPRVKPHSSRATLIGVVVVVLLVVVGLVLNSVLTKDPPSLPHFTEQRPAYGTIHMTVTYSEQTGPEVSYTSESNASADVVHIVGVEKPGVLDYTSPDTKFEYIVSADEFWVYDFGQELWMKGMTPDAGSYAAARDTVTTLMFSEYIPESLRPYVAIEDVTDDTVSGHEVTVYDLRLDLASYHNSGAAEYDEWATRLGIEKPAANTTMELSVDDNGVVWRMRSFSTSGQGQAQWRSTDYEQIVDALLPADYRPVYPSTYYDEASNEVVG